MSEDEKWTPMQHRCDALAGRAMTELMSAAEEFGIDIYSPDCPLVGREHGFAAGWFWETEVIENDLSTLRLSISATRGDVVRKIAEVFEKRAAVGEFARLARHAALRLAEDVKREERSGEFDPWKETRGYVGVEGTTATETAGRFLRVDIEAMPDVVWWSGRDEPVEREPTVAEKWAKRISERLERVVYATGVADVMMEDGEWIDAREQLRAMRDEIDRALAEIEPLAVEQGGTPDNP